jgi:hypothetical protein
METQYIMLLDDNELKSKSLTDCIRYTLRDVFWNAEDESRCQKSSELMSVDLNNDKYIKELYGFLSAFEKHSFYRIEFNEIEEGEHYIKFNDWFEQLQILVEKLERIIIDRC